MMNDQFQKRCPRCGVGRRLSWDQLNDEEREVVRRLPASAEYSQEEREATHTWCTNCWHEEAESTAYDV